MQWTLFFPISTLNQIYLHSYLKNEESSFQLLFEWHFNFIDRL
jgi:hypothetical protein